MRHLRRQSGGRFERRGIGRGVRDALALAAIFLLVPAIGLAALVAPPWAVSRVTAPLWRTVWASVGETFSTTSTAPALEATSEPLVRVSFRARSAAPAAPLDKTGTASVSRKRLADDPEPVAAVYHRVTLTASPPPPAAAKPSTDPAPEPPPLVSSAPGDASPQLPEEDAPAATPRPDPAGGSDAPEAGDGNAADVPGAVAPAPSAPEVPAPEEDLPPGCGQGGSAPGCDENDGDGNGGNENGNGPPALPPGQEKNRSGSRRRR